MKVTLRPSRYRWINGRSRWYMEVPLNSNGIRRYLVDQSGKMELQLAKAQMSLVWIIESDIWGLLWRYNLYLINTIFCVFYWCDFIWHLFYLEHYLAMKKIIILRAYSYEESCGLTCWRCYIANTFMIRIAKIVSHDFCVYSVGCSRPVLLLFSLNNSDWCLSFSVRQVWLRT